MRRLILGCVLFAGGCTADLGACDQPAALEIVYDQSGVPSFAGQALMAVSCGNGGFCHAESDVGPSERFGAPGGLAFDVAVATVTNEAAEEAAERLRLTQSRVLAMAGEIHGQVSAGRMPPSGEAGDAYFAQVSARFTRFDDAGSPTGELPGIDEQEGREMLRNWLACGAPMVERTVARVDQEPNVVGFTVPGCDLDCVDPTWGAIHERVVVPTCARSACHDATDAAAGMQLSGDPDDVLLGLIGVVSEGELCGADDTPRIIPNDAAGSLLFQKIAAASRDDVCGSRMPLSANPLGPQRLCAIRAWIECGACGVANAADCEACVAAERADCNVPPAGAAAMGACTTPLRCDNRVEP